MTKVLLEARLAFHALKKDALDLGISNRGDVEQGKQRGEFPRLEAIPHLQHGGWTKGDEVGECVVEEESLVHFVVMAANKARLTITC